MGADKSIQRPAGSYPLCASDHNYPFVRIDRRTAAQGGAWPIWSGHDDRASSPSPAGTPAPSGSRSARRARSPWRPTVPVSCSCAPAPVRTGRTRCGCSTWRTAGSASRPTRAPCSAARSEDLSAEERARRERSREGGAGIVCYATDTAVELASFALSGRLFTAELRAGTARELPVPGPVIDPRPSPDGRHIAYVARGALRVVGAEGEGDRALAEPESDGVTYGLAEFIAAEEMGRYAGLLVVVRSRTGCWWRGRTTRRCAAGGSPIRRIPSASRSRSPTRRRGRPTRRYGCS